MFLLIPSPDAEDNDATRLSTREELGPFAKRLCRGNPKGKFGLSSMSPYEHGYRATAAGQRGSARSSGLFLARVDTSPDGQKNIKPIRVTDYDGKDVVL